MNKLSLSAVLFLATALASYAATDRTTDKPATSYVNTISPALTPTTSALICS